MKWQPVVLILLLVAYGWLWLQIILVDRKIRQAQAQLEALRPAVVEVVETKERQATTAAHRQFAAACEAAAVDWEAVFQQLSVALPPSVMLETLTVDGPHLALHGVLRYPPAEPQEYLAQVAAALKPGVFREVMATVTPPEPDDPSVARVELKGELQ